MSNPKYDEDILRLDVSYNRHSVINAETVIIVTGTGVVAELLDRPTAEVIRDVIDSRGGKYPYRRAIVVSDSAWYAEAILANKAVIAIGGPPANNLSDEFSKWSPPSGSKEGVYSIREQGKVKGFFRHNELGLPQVGLWGDSAASTRFAVNEYINRAMGLGEFLGMCWRPN